MKNIIRMGLLVMTLLFFPTANGSAQTAPLLPSAETPAQREARLAWWREARFGLFIHWGPASVNGTEISWSRIGHPRDHKGMETVPPEVYDNLYKQFNPEQFDANAWMQLAQDAGMKYVVFITKHHDGFSMWPTQLRPDYSIAATPFKRDLCKEIADAAHQHGLKLGWYYSTRDWTHPDYLVGDNRKYDAFYRGQVRELISNYGRVDMLWFDHVAGNWRDYDFPALYNMLFTLQPGIVVNDRAARFFLPTDDKPTPEIAALTKGDFDTPEQKIGKFQNDRPWESCITITECKDGGGWSYRPDGRTRRAKECIQMLASCASGDGNLLLNVGPMPTGEIEAGQVAVLREIGQWMKQNGESIYGTRGGPYHNGAWGGATYKGNTVYLHVFRWNGDTLKLPALQAKVVKAAALNGAAVKMKQTKKALEFTLATASQDPSDTVIKIELKAPAANELKDGKPLPAAE